MFSSPFSPATTTPPHPHTHRRKPVLHAGVQYDLSLLITNDQTETMAKDKLVDWVIAFMMDISKELSDMKIQVCTS